MNDTLDAVLTMAFNAANGAGERFFGSLAGRLDQYECVELVSSNAATHPRIT